MILRNGIINYQILKLFPELGSPELVFRNLNYIYGCHPYHNRSFVSGVGAQPKGWLMVITVPTTRSFPAVSYRVSAC